jgi:hypothetical protein
MEGWFNVNLIEDYTEIFYMIHEVYVPSIQCEVSLRWSKSPLPKGGSVMSKIMIATCIPNAHIFIMSVALQS